MTVLVIRCIKWGENVALRWSRWTDVRLIFFDLFLKYSLFFIMEVKQLNNYEGVWKKECGIVRYKVTIECCFNYNSICAST